MRRPAGFYILLAATMMAAGFDPLVGAATVLLGAGSGVLGSTINPFATGAAVAAAGVEVNMGIVYVEAIILWLATYFISALFVTRYAKKVKEGKGSILTADQLDECKKAYGSSTEIDANVKLTGRQKGVLVVFGLSFVVMILGFIPWGSLNEGIYNTLSFWYWLTGNGFGDWWFDDAATWFLLMGLLIGLIGLEDKSKLMPCIVAGFADMISVNLVIALARATTVIMSTTGLGTWLVEASVTALSASGLPAPAFGALDYLLHIGLSFLVLFSPLRPGEPLRPDRFADRCRHGLVRGDFHHDQRRCQRPGQPVHPHLRLHHGRSGSGPRALRDLAEVGWQAPGHHRCGRRRGPDCGYARAELMML